MRYRVATVLGIAIFFQASALLWNCYWNSPTIDEPGHLQSGLIIHEYGRFEVYAVNPPLIRAVATFPAHLWGLRPYDDQLFLDASSRWEFIAGTKLFEKHGAVAMKGLVISRMTLVPLVLIGTLLIWKWSVTVFGVWPAIVSTSMWIFAPMLLGHGALITPDVGATVLGMLALYRFRQWLRTATWTNAIVFGIATGTALLSKFTWFVVLPLTYVIVFTFWHCFVFASERRTSRDVQQICIAACVVILLLNAGYGFAGSFSPLGNIKFVSHALKPTNSMESVDPNVRLANRFSSSGLARIPVPVPKLYLQGIDVQMRDFEPGQMGKSFLFGQWQDQGWWYYYLAAGLVKLPVPCLLIAGLSFCIVMSAVYQMVRNLLQNKAKIESPLTRCGEILLCLVPSLIVVGIVSSQTGFNHHFRYLLPAYPGFLLAVGALIGGVRQNRQRVMRRMVFALLLIQLVTVAGAAPHWIAFVNHAATNVASREQILSDSNVDWGQDLLRLKAWQDSQPMKSPLRMLVFTHVAPHDLGIASEPIGVPVNSEIVESREIVPSDLDSGWYAVSTCVKQGRSFKLYHQKGGIQMVTSGATFFGDLDPIHRIGSSVELFRFEPPLVNTKTSTE